VRPRLRAASSWPTRHYQLGVPRLQRQGLRVRPRLRAESSVAYAQLSTRCPSSSAARASDAATASSSKLVGLSAIINSVVSLVVSGKGIVCGHDFEQQARWPTRRYQLGVPRLQWPGYRVRTRLRAVSSLAYAPSPTRCPSSSAARASCAATASSSMFVGLRAIINLSSSSASLARAVL